MTQSQLERAFDRWWHMLAHDSPAPEAEFRFHPVRRWRLDFAWPGARVGVELQGGTFTRGRHTRGAGYERDCEKLNALQSAGWRVFYVTAGMLRDNPASVVEMIQEAL